jgi:hypothetical protein
MNMFLQDAKLVVIVNKMKCAFPRNVCAPKAIIQDKMVALMKMNVNPILAIQVPHALMFLVRTNAHVLLA